MAILLGQFRATSHALRFAKSTAVEITFCEVLSLYENIFIKFPVSRMDSAEFVVKFRE